MGHRIDIGMIGPNTDARSAALAIASDLLRREMQTYRRYFIEVRCIEESGTRGIRLKQAKRQKAKAMRRVNGALRLYHFAELDSRGALDTTDQQEERYEHAG